MYARVAAKSSEEEEDEEARAERRMGFGRPSFNDGRQQEMVGETDAVGQPGHVEAECVRVGDAHLWRRRGGNKKGDWSRYKAGTSNVGRGVCG